MFARNPWNREFAGRVAFADLGGRQTTCTGDRLEFLGRNAGLDHPASLERGRELSGKTGAGLDPCAALQTKVDLDPGERAEVVFLLGQGESHDVAGSLVEHYRTIDCDAALLEVKQSWDRVLGAVQAIDMLAAGPLRENRTEGTVTRVNTSAATRSAVQADSSHPRSDTIRGNVCTGSSARCEQRSMGWSTAARSRLRRAVGRLRCH